MTRAVFAVLILLIPCAATAASPGEAFRGHGPDRLWGGGRGKRAILDHRAFWMYRFEHEKESIIADRITALRKRVERPTPEDVREHVLPVLHKALVHRNSQVRHAATVALGKIGGKVVVPYLKTRVEQDPDSQVVEAALLALGLTGEPQAVPILVEALASKSWHRRDFAALGLGLSAREEARKPLRDTLEAALREETKDEDFLSCLTVALGRVGTAEDLPRFARILKLTGHRPLKVHVCQALGRIGGDGARDLLLSALRIRKEPVHAAGALALRRFPDAKAANALFRKYGVGCGYTSVKNMALIALARWSSRPETPEPIAKAAAPVVAESVEAPQRNIYAAMFAALAQGEFGRRDSIPYFVHLLQARELHKVREENATAVVMALGLLRETSATARIRELMANGPFGPDSRGYCAFALGLMGDRTQVAAVRVEMKKEAVKDDFLRSGCWALALIGGKEDIPFLRTLLEPHPDRDKYVRGAAAIAIGLLGDRETLTELVTLAKESEHDSVRALALAAIGWLADRDPVPRLPRLFHGLLDREAAEPIQDAWSLL